jgi:hypothetical protein
MRPGGKLLTLLETLDVLSIEVIKHHEACTHDPDNQQNLPSFHIPLPFQLKQ